jgi:hypothetical protein
MTVKSIDTSLAHQGISTLCHLITLCSPTDLHQPHNINDTCHTILQVHRSRTFDQAVRDVDLLHGLPCSLQRFSHVMSGMNASSTAERSFLATSCTAMILS